jgi:hypothetical protein
VSGPTPSDPTPEQIAAACAAIRAGWSDGERQRRNAERTQRPLRESPLDSVLYDELGEPLVDMEEEPKGRQRQTNYKAKRRGEALWKKAQKFGVATAKEMAERLERGDVRCRHCLTWFARTSPELAPSAVKPRAVSVACRKCWRALLKEYRKQRNAA